MPRDDDDDDHHHHYVDDDDDDDGGGSGSDGDGGVASLSGATVELPPQFDWRHRPAPTAVATLRDACVRSFEYSVVREVITRQRRNSHTEGYTTTARQKR